MNSVTIISDDYQGHVDYTRHACRGIIVKDNLILLTYESKRNRYMIPGGGVEDNEALVDCVKREVLEETGIIVDATEPYFDIYEYFYWDQNWEHINHYFICNIIKETKSLKLTEKEKYSGCSAVWVTIETALNIFCSYEKYKSDYGKYGLYYRELLALKEYLSIK